jgi:hypothetical protein
VRRGSDDGRADFGRKRCDEFFEVTEAGVPAVQASGQLLDELPDGRVDTFG